MRRSAWLVLLTGCIDGGTSSSSVGSTLDGPRILAVISEPAESKPGAQVHLQAVVTGAAGDLPSWALCTTPRRPLDNAAVAPACAGHAEQPLDVRALMLDVRIPDDACSVFGSETPAGSTPNPPDATGGYYQPLRVELGGETAVARVRIECQLAAAPIDAVQAFRARYPSNQAPTLDALRVALDGREVDLTRVPPGRQLSLQVELSAPETYPRYDPSRGLLEDVREQQTVSWFVSAGRVTPELSEALASPVEATWTLPLDVDAAQLWVVGRDDRGASVYLERALQFQR